MTIPERDAEQVRFGLAELVDFELQLASDRGRPYEELHERDRQIALRWPEQPKTPQQMAARWVAALRGSGAAPTAGEKVARAHGLANLLVFVSFLLIGVGVALAVLQFTGDHPINVLVVLGVFVVLQLVNLLVTLAAFSWSRSSPGFLRQFPLVAVVQRLIARAVGPEHVGRFLARRSIYGGVERWIWFRTMQLGALAFNIGAIVTFVGAVSFTDMAFAWSTTLQVEAQGLQRFCAALAFPWRAWWPEAVPSLELIETTQYFRLDAAYVGAPPGMRARDAAAAGGWWPFLLMCLLVYGLLPRLLLVIWAGWGATRSLRRLPLDTPEEAEVIARLTTPWVHDVHGEDPGNVAPLGRGRAPLPRPAPLGDDQAVILVRWRDAEIGPDQLIARVRRRLGAVVDEPIGNAGGRDHAEEQTLLARLEASPEQPVLVVVEPWNAPDRAFGRFVRNLRQRGHAHRKIYVLLTEQGDEQQHAVWAGYLAELEDPYIALGEA
ncbi:MAG TPA: DUF2868 domain-containing protein [Polyangiales bacterium]|nr:DUF2868 domain-containing protein [Polyangiales bacterium]